MKLGIVGLPNVGKSTLFNALTKAGAEAASYPYSTIEPNVGMVDVPDERLVVLHEMYNSKKTTYATIEFCDIAGLAAGASRGAGLGNRFLGYIREVDALVHVVRCFEDENVMHVSEVINPVDDIETLNLELILSDVEILERRVDKTTKGLKADKGLQKELDILKKLLENLNEGVSARSIDFDEDEKEFVKSLTLLSYKPIIYVMNVSEEDSSDESENKHYAAVKELADSENSDVVVVSAKFEAEISELDEEEKMEFLKDMNISESGLVKMIQSSYHLLDLMSFLTAGEPEVRAWTIKKGMKAPKAAGKIHSDIERGFIRAETISYENLVACGSLVAAKEKGLVRSEGKEYVVKDGDVIHFLFNV